MVQYISGSEFWPPAEIVQIRPGAYGYFDFEPLCEAVTRRRCPGTPVPTHRADDFLEFLVWGPGPLQTQTPEEA